MAQDWGANPPPGMSAPPSASRYSDKRRYTSRVAARERRSVESDLLQDLGRSLPLTQFTLNSLDKISILRLAVTSLKLRKIFGGNARTACHRAGALAPFPEEALHGGFLVVLSSEGDVLHVSESISECLGLTSVEVTGRSLFEYTHQNDRPDLARLLLAPGLEGGTTRRTGMVRLKCNLFPHINPLHFRPCSNKVIHLSGRMYLSPTPGAVPCFIGVGRIIPHPADGAYPLSTVDHVFTTVHSIKDLTVINVDERMRGLIRFTPEEMINTKAVLLVHADDAHRMMLDVRDLFTKGQSLTQPYRFMAKGGGWRWVISECSTLFTSTYRANQLCPASAVMCRNMVVSGIQEDEVICVDQIPSRGAQYPEAEDQSQPQSEDAVSLLEELLHSGSESDGGEFSPAGVTPGTDSPELALVKQEAFSLEQYDDLTFLRDLMEFSTLPEFNEVLEALLVTEGPTPARATDDQGYESAANSEGAGSSPAGILGLEAAWSPPGPQKRKAELSPEGVVEQKVGPEELGPVGGYELKYPRLGSLLLQAGAGQGSQNLAPEWGNVHK